MTAAHTKVLPTVPVLVILAAEWRFGARLPGHPELVGRQVFFPFFISLAGPGHVLILTATVIVIQDIVLKLTRIQSSMTT